MAKKNVKQLWEHGPETSPWEFHTDDYSTRRLRVPGGWIVVSSNYITDEGYDGELHTSYSESSCFVADPKHQWKLD